jgi:hypothetical protein
MVVSKDPILLDVVRENLSFDGVSEDPIFDVVGEGLIFFGASEDLILGVR